MCFWVYYFHLKFSFEILFFLVLVVSNTFNLRHVHIYIHKNSQHTMSLQNMFTSHLQVTTMHKLWNCKTWGELGEKFSWSSGQPPLCTNFLGKQPQILRHEFYDPKPWPPCVFCFHQWVLQALSFFRHKAAEMKTITLNAFIKNGDKSQYQWQNPGTCKGSGDVQTGIQRTNRRSGSEKTN